MKLKEYLKKRSNVELQDIKLEIEALKCELGRLIELGASYKEIYKVSVKLDELIVLFYRTSLGKPVN